MLDEAEGLTASCPPTTPCSGSGCSPAPSACPPPPAGDAALRDRRPAQLPDPARLGEASLQLGSRAGALEPERWSPALREERAGALAGGRLRRAHRSFDNLGEAAELELGALAADAPLGRHEAALEVLPRLLGQLEGRQMPPPSSSRGSMRRSTRSCSRDRRRRPRGRLPRLVSRALGRSVPIEETANLERGLAAFGRLGLESRACDPRAASSAQAALASCASRPAPLLPRRRRGRLRRRRRPAALRVATC